MTLYAKGKQLQMRTSSGFHDRAGFIDERGWLVGQSLKDAAHKKPTTVIERLDPTLTRFRDVLETIWAGAAVVV